MTVIGHGLCEPHSSSHSSPFGKTFQVCLEVAHDRFSKKSNLTRIESAWFYVDNKVVVKPAAVNNGPGVYWVQTSKNGFGASNCIFDLLHKQIGF